jgi:hypothetical protein
VLAKVRQLLIPVSDTGVSVGERYAEATTDVFDSITIPVPVSVFVFKRFVKFGSCFLFLLFHSFLSDVCKDSVRAAPCHLGLCEVMS